MTTENRVPKIGKQTLWAEPDDGHPWLEEVHDGEPDDNDKECILIWREDYDALRGKVEVLQRLADRYSREIGEMAKELEELRAARAKMVTVTGTYQVAEDHD